MKKKKMEEKELKALLAASQKRNKEESESSDSGEEPVYDDDFDACEDITDNCHGCGLTTRQEVRIKCTLCDKWWHATVSPRWTSKKNPRMTWMQWTFSCFCFLFVVFFFFFGLFAVLISFVLFESFFLHFFFPFSFVFFFFRGLKNYNPLLSAALSPSTPFPPPPPPPAPVISFCSSVSVV